MQENGYKLEWRGEFEYDSQLNEFFDSLPELPMVIDGKDAIYNVPSSFDIETSSFKSKDGEKHACMYIWQFGLAGSIIYGRTWSDWLDFLNTLVDYLHLNEHTKLYIYVHNLAYEFQFMRGWFKWEKVFAIKNRRPVYAICGAPYKGIEFRCSLFLSNYALAYIGDNLLTKYPVKKLVGDLDYSKARHSKTPLTDKELQYCFNDVKVVMSYIQEKIEVDGDISKIPLTNTGYVRNYCREECFYEDCETEEDRKRVFLNYRAIMKSLTVDTLDEYKQLKRGFMGGFTHASCLHSNQIMYDVGSADLTSSYPFVMCAEYFPISKSTSVGNVEDGAAFRHFLKTKCCLFDIEIKNLKPINEYENPISVSRCMIYGKSTTNNGRVVTADRLQTTMTELDFDTCEKFYTWDSIKILNMRIYERGYLPKALIMAILKLYRDKTQLKGIEGKEIEYLVSKNMINSAFGMMVTAIVRNDYTYVDHWNKEVHDDGSAQNYINKYNKNFNRFLYYGWGVWVTAHARHNLFSAIYEFGEDYVYADTDSIKGLNFGMHAKYFQDYNDQVLEKLLKMCNHYNIPFSMCQPKTKKGISKRLGVWEMEEPYLRFKTCGAKRYIFEHMDGKLDITVSGLNKKYAVPYLLETYDDDHDLIFEVFGDGMYIEAGHTGKLTMTYIDEHDSGVLVDYLGHAGIFDERSSIHMEPQSYFMSMVGDYLKFLEGVQYEEY